MDLGNTVNLTYCGNVHPAADLPGWLDTVATHGVPVAMAQRRAGHAFGLGAWWNAATAQALALDPRAIEAARATLAEHDLSIWTVNVFPQSSFGGGPVKERVYEPDWTSEERVLYVRHVAEAVARLGSGLAMVPLSTLPLGYRPGRRYPEGDPEEWRLMGRNLVRVASHLRAMEEEWGLRMVLALEPEPFCLLETVAAAVSFLERWVFLEGGWDTIGEDVLRRHVGVCVDLCHLAVVGEEPVASLTALRSADIELAKIQVSSCLEVRDPAQPEALDRLLAFDEPVYLHQTIAADGARALDLPEVRSAREDFSKAPLRTHFHMPVFWDQEGAFGSTRSEVSRVLRFLARPDVAHPPLLEVETYTWGVLEDMAGTLGPGDLAPGKGLIAGLLQELAFVRSHWKP